MATIHFPAPRANGSPGRREEARKGGRRSTVDKDIILGADIGTSSCKASLIATSGEFLGTRIHEYPTLFPKLLYAEQDPEDWWRAFLSVTRELLSATRIDPEHIRAVSISGNTPSVLPLGHDGVPLRRAMIWMDRRSERECKSLRGLKDRIDIERITMTRIDPSFPLAKLAWLSANEPEIFSQARTYLQSNGYIVFKLTGTFSQDISHCLLTQLWDIDRGEWSEQICSIVHLDINQLPRVYRCDEVVGEVSGEAAELSGLRKGTPVIAGCNDGAASSLGVGVVGPGQAYVVMGQAGGLGFCTDRKPSNPKIANYHYPVPGIWFSLAPMAAFGASFRWARDKLFCKTEHPYLEMDRLAESARPGSGGVIFLPYMIGERAPLWDSAARGVFFGLTLSTTVADLFRAILEGTAFSVLHNIEQFEQEGASIGSLICAGGGSRSKLWNQIISNVCGREVITMQNEDNVTLGNMLLAACATGVYTDFHEAARKIVKQGTRFAPVASDAASYRGLFRIYKRLYPNLRENFIELSEWLGGNRFSN